MSTDTDVGPAGREVRQTHRVVIRFAGDSGDGMQLTGDRFTSEAAAFGNDLATLPNFPAENPCPCRHAARGVELPAPLRGLRHPHARRPPQSGG